MERASEDLYGSWTGVIELHQKDFDGDKVISSDFQDKYGMIMFYAPWCNHCQAAVEKWSDLAIQFKNRFVFAAVNCENPQNILICREFNISYFPQIKFVTKSGKVYPYKGDDNKDELIYFACTKL